MVEGRGVGTCLFKLGAGGDHRGEKRDAAKSLEQGAHLEL